MFGSMFARNRARRALGARLLDEIGKRSRAAVFYRDYAVADTTDGRFDLLVLHAWLVLDRLRELGRRDAAQALTDALFSDFETALREQAAGDSAMVRGLKRLTEAFHGRLAAYGQAGEKGLAAAIERNLYRSPADTPSPQACALAAYAFSLRQGLQGWMDPKQPLAFAPLPG